MIYRKREEYLDPEPTPADERERDARHAELERQVFSGKLHWTALVKPGVPVDCGCRPGRPCYWHVS